jgi:predicted nucleic acid-binding protein
LGERLFAGELVQIYHVTEEDVQESWRTFRRFSDKGWSFTDCTSRVIMAKLGITHAFAFDDDFRQFGTVIVVP